MDEENKYDGMAFAALVRLVDDAFYASNHTEVRSLLTEMGVRLEAEMAFAAE